MAWVETESLLADIVSASRVPLPESVLAHLRQRLDGTARKRQGRGRIDPSTILRNTLIAAMHQRCEAWLEQRAKRHGLEGWPRIRGAEWWQGPPSERAARMVQRHYRLAMSWERVRNIAYEVRNLGPRNRPERRTRESS